MTKAPKKRKRGRPFMGKTNRLSTKITPETTAALEREAKRTKRSKSHVAELILQEAFKTPDKTKSERAWGKPHVKAMAALIADLITRIELQTQNRWQTDRYTYEALQYGINALLSQLAPDDQERRTPDHLVQGDGEFAINWGNPETVGSANAAGLWQQLMTTEPPPLDHPVNTRYADGFYKHPKLRKDLGLEGGENE